MECLIVNGKSRRGWGFTLIELLTVMAIIALLLALALPRYFGHIEKSREVILKQDLSTMRDAIDKFHGDKGRYPESLNELVDSHYLRSVPVDPITDSPNAWVTVAPPSDETGTVYDIKSGAPGKAKDGTAYGLSLIHI